MAYKLSQPIKTEINTIMEVLNHAGLSPIEFARIENELGEKHNLKDVMDWALSSPEGIFIPRIVANVVVQDEFTHDVIVPFRDSLILVYDTT